VKYIYIIFVVSVLLWQLIHGTQKRGTTVVKDEFPSSCDERLEASLEDMNDDCRLTPHYLTLLQNELTRSSSRNASFLIQIFENVSKCTRFGYFVLRGTFNVFDIFSALICWACACINWYLTGVLRRRCPKLLFFSKCFSKKKSQTAILCSYPPFLKGAFCSYCHSCFVCGNMQNWILSLPWLIYIRDLSQSLPYLVLE